MDALLEQQKVSSVKDAQVLNAYKELGFIKKMSTTERLGVLMTLDVLTRFVGLTAAGETTTIEDMRGGERPVVKVTVGNSPPNTFGKVALEIGMRDAVKVPGQRLDQSDTTYLVPYLRCDKPDHIIAPPSKGKSMGVKEVVVVSMTRQQMMQLRSFLAPKSDLGVKK